MKGTVSVISSDPPCNNGNTRFTLKSFVWSSMNEVCYCFFKLLTFICSFPAQNMSKCTEKRQEHQNTEEKKSKNYIFLNHHVKHKKLTLLKGTVNGISSHPPFPQIHAGFTIEILKLLSQGKQWCPCFFRFAFLQHRKKKTTEFNTLKNYDFFSFLLEKRWKEQVYV